MVKCRDTRKNVKKEPLKTAKEKRAKKNKREYFFNNYSLNL